MAIDLLLGLQWGDEGKGKIVDVLTKKYNIIARFQGGPNAGHTLEFEGIKHVLHTIPSGIFHPKAINLVGNGVVIDPVIFKQELENLTPFDINVRESLLVSRKAHLILPTHRLLDAASEMAKGKAKIGSTLKGIGPTYMDKTGRNGIRIGDIELSNWKEKYAALRDKHLNMIENMHVPLEFSIENLETAFFEAVAYLKSAVSFVDSEEYLRVAQENKQHILAEGAQGSLLDIDFGTYPFVTSSNTTAAGACTGLGIAPNRIGEVFGIFKAYTTRVGSGPFPTELFDETGEIIGRVGHEFGATTGRSRRCGWLDLIALKYAVEINGVTQLMMMKGDVLSGFDELKICTAYTYQGETIEHLPYSLNENEITPQYTTMKGWKEDLTTMRTEEELPNTFNEYIAFIEDFVKTPISIVSVGPDRSQTIFRSSE